MVNATFMPKRHPESGIYLFRKRVPERLRDLVGRHEIKFSLQTRDPALARLRNLEELARLERAWAEIDGTRTSNSERFASYLDATFSRMSAATRGPVEESSLLGETPTAAFSSGLASDQASAPRRRLEWRP